MNVLPEIRRDPLSGRMVVVATERRKRPHQLVFRAVAQKTEQACPFCEGNEELTPPEKLAYRKNGIPNGEGWTVRVFDNKFPAFVQEEGESDLSGLFQHVPAKGFHEVVVFSTHHDKSLGQLPFDNLVLVLKAIQERLKTLCAEPEVKDVVAIVNHRPEAGASLPHPHAQIFATPIITPLVAHETSNLKSYKEETGRCLICDLAQEEAKKDKRVILHKNGFLSLSPYASRLPFETMIIPMAHSSNYEEIGEPEMNGLAEHISTILGLYINKLNDPPYNLVIHNKPCNIKGDYHWHVEIVPRITMLAGFEIASAMTINIVSPEFATKFLKS